MKFHFFSTQVPFTGLRKFPFQGCSASTNQIQKYHTVPGCNAKAQQTKITNKLFTYSYSDVSNLHVFVFGRIQFILLGSWICNSKVGFMIRERTRKKGLYFVHVFLKKQFWKQHFPKINFRLLCMPTQI